MADVMVTLTKDEAEIVKRWAKDEVGALGPICKDLGVKDKNDCGEAWDLYQAKAVLKKLK